MAIYTLQKPYNYKLSKNIKTILLFFLYCHDAITLIFHIVEVQNEQNKKFTIKQ